MKSINLIKKLIFCLSIVALLSITHISAIKNKKEKSENLKNVKSKTDSSAESESERKKHKVTSSAKLRSSNAHTAKESAHNTLKNSIQAKAAATNASLDTSGLSAYRQLNWTTHEKQDQKIQDFIQKNRKWDFKILDKQLEEIAIDMNFKSDFGTSPNAIRSFIKYFINYFERCDTDFDNLLSREEFAGCLKNDTFLSRIDIPDSRFAAIQSSSLNYTNFTDYSGFLFDLLDTHKMGKLSFYNYMNLRLITFSWTKCSVSAPFIEESNFECAIEVAAGWKTMQRNQARRVFYLALELSGSDTIRNLDFLSYAAVALSVRLYGRINGKEDNDVTKTELLLALDNNILPLRYNQETVQQLLALTTESDKENEGIDLVSFVFYDFWLRIFDYKNAKKRYQLSVDEFIIVLTTPLYPPGMYDIVQKIPQNNLTDNAFQMYTYLNITNFQDESDHFLKSFIEANVNVDLANKKEKNNMKKSQNNNKWSLKEAAAKMNTFTYNQQKTLTGIFNVIDNDFDGAISFYDFASFVQVNYIFLKYDKYRKGRIPAGQLGEDLVSYSDYPVVSHKFRERAKRFNLMPADLYVDLSSAVLVLKIDDIVDANVRRSDKNTLFEVELKNIFTHVNRQHVPEAYLNKCLRGNSPDNIPLYDWECAVVESEIRALTYFENSMDYLTVKSQNITLFNTVFYNKDSSLDN